MFSEFQLVESLSIVLSGWTPSGTTNGNKIDIFSHDEESKPSGPEATDELKISAKIFVTSAKGAALTEAINSCEYFLNNFT